MSIIRFVDALAGAGKTSVAIQHSLLLANRGFKALIVMPSIRLIQQTEQNIRAENPMVRVKALYGDGAHGSGTSANVIGDIITHSKTTADGGEILMITHAAFFRVPYFERRQDWILIIDEIPQVVWSGEFQIADTHHLLTEHLDTEPDGRLDNRYVRVVPKDRNALEVMLKNQNDDEVYDRFRELLGKFLSPDWRTYVLDRQYQDLIDEEADRQSLWIFSLLSPSVVDGFKSVTIMGACFQQSALYHLWRREGVKFESHKRLHESLRYIEHQNGGLLTIRYATDEPWSKTYRDRAAETNECETRTVLDHIVTSIGDLLDGQKFVWMGNADLPDTLFDGPAVRLPNSPHGLNSFQHVHSVAVLSALNPAPAHFGFLKAAGLDSEEVRQACFWQQVYQAVMRVSLRNPEDISPKTVIVMDRQTADWLAVLFPGCKVEPLECGLKLPSKKQSGRPRKHRDTADRKVAYRDQFKRELIAELELINGKELLSDLSGHLTAELRKQMSEFGRGLLSCGAPALANSIFASIKNATPFSSIPADDTETFIEVLRHCHAFVWSQKRDNMLISPAVFDANLSPETSRGLDNIRALWGLWLDNDGGDLTPEAFARMFPRLRIVIFNSFNSTPDAPRWRAFIPTTLAMSINAYRAIVGQVMRTVNEAGYWSDKQLKDNRKRKSTLRHGFDESKFVPSSLFYMPCQAEDPAGSFFKDFNGHRRQPLDPFQWAKFAANRARPEIEQAPLPASVPSPQQPVAENDNISLEAKKLRDDLRAVHTKSRQAERRQVAIEEWRLTPRGAGNAGFFRLAVQLQKAGVPLDEIRQTLHQEAVHSHSPADRRANIQAIIRRLRSGPAIRAA